MSSFQELYEPLWEELYNEAKSRNLRVRSILIADAAWQGQSGLINKDALGNDRKTTPPPPLLFNSHTYTITQQAGSTTPVTSSR